jgi:hypothetical protein
MSKKSNMSKMSGRQAAEMLAKVEELDEHENNNVVVPV